MFEHKNIETHTLLVVSDECSHTSDSLQLNYAVTHGMRGKRANNVLVLL